MRASVAVAEARMAALAPRTCAAGVEGRRLGWLATGRRASEKSNSNHCLRSNGLRSALEGANTLRGRDASSSEERFDGRIDCTLLRKKRRWGRMIPQED